MKSAAAVSVVVAMAVGCKGSEGATGKVGTEAAASAGKVVEVKVEASPEAAGAGSAALAPPKEEEVVIFLEGWCGAASGGRDRYVEEHLGDAAVFDLKGPARSCAERACALDALATPGRWCHAAIGDAMVQIIDGRAFVKVSTRGLADVGVPSMEMEVELHRRSAAVDDSGVADLVVDKVEASWQALSLPLETRFTDLREVDAKPATLSATARAAVVAEAAARVKGCASPRVAATAGTPVFALAICPGGKGSSGDDVVWFAVRDDEVLSFAATDHGPVDPDAPTYTSLMDDQPLVFDDQVCAWIQDDDLLSGRGHEGQLCAPRPDL